MFNKELTKSILSLREKYPEACVTVDVADANGHERVVVVISVDHDRILARLSRRLPESAAASECSENEAIFDALVLAGASVSTIELDTVAGSTETACASAGPGQATEGVPDEGGVQNAEEAKKAAVDLIPEVKSARKKPGRKPKKKDEVTEEVSERTSINEEAPLFAPLLSDSVDHSVETPSVAAEPEMTLEEARAAIFEIVDEKVATAMNIAKYNGITMDEFCSRRKAFLSQLAKDYINGVSSYVSERTAKAAEIIYRDCCRK